MKRINGRFLPGLGRCAGSIEKKKKDPNEVKEDAKPPSPAAMAVRLKFSMVTHFLAKASSLIKFGYKKKIKNYASAMNIAVKETLRDAVLGKFPNFSINYAKVVLSKDGYLDEPWNVNIRPVGSTGIRITWEIIMYPRPESYVEDLAMVFLYCEQTDQGVTVEGVAKRKDLGVTLKLDPGFAGYQFHVWFFFMAENKKNVSSSLYLGEIKLVK